MTLEVDNWVVPADSKEFTLTGNLTIKDVTRPVTFKGEFGGIVKDGYGNTKAAAELTAVINRTDWGLNWNSPLQTGGVLVGEEVTIHIDAQGVLADKKAEETDAELADELLGD
jgi:polyisoprenoid-binding protein YceI